MAAAGGEDPRKARLAQALRSNLKRRKAAERAGEGEQRPAHPATAAEDAPPDPSARG